MSTPKPLAVSLEVKEHAKWSPPDSLDASLLEGELAKLLAEEMEKGHEEEEELMMVEEEEGEEEEEEEEEEDVKTDLVLSAEMEGALLPQLSMVVVR